jgi:hypothetical protein
MRTIDGLGRAVLLASVIGSGCDLLSAPKEPAFGVGIMSSTACEEWRATGELPRTLSALVPKYASKIDPDPWDQPYTWQGGGDLALLRSSGPDRLPWTDDDLIVSVEIQGDRCVRHWLKSTKGSRPLVGIGRDGSLSP